MSLDFLLKIVHKSPIQDKEEPNNVKSFIIRSSSHVFQGRFCQRITQNNERSTFLLRKRRDIFIELHGWTSIDWFESSSIDEGDIDESVLSLYRKALWLDIFTSSFDQIL